MTRISVEDFNELVWDYGANGNDSSRIRELTDDEREVVAMAWSRSDMDDEEINSYYSDFVKVCSNEIKN